MQNKKWITLFLTLCIGFCIMAFASCDLLPQTSETSQLQQIYSQYVVSMQEQEKTPLTYEQWLSVITGEQNAQTDTLPVFPQGEIEEMYVDQNGHLIVKIVGEEPQDLGVIEIKTENDDTNDENNNNDENNDNSDNNINDENSVYKIDFTKATNVKNVTDQGYYLDGCPTTGKPKVLVIPVEFSDVTAQSKGYQISKLKTIFNGADGTTDYHSVHNYYYQSSYGQLDLDITVLDEWFKPANTSSYYKKQTITYYDEQTDIGDQMVMDEALAYLSTKMDLSQFDSDNNDIIDAVILITTLTIDSDYDFYWAYRYWNIYTDRQGYYYEYDGVSANDYLWASYQFIFEKGNGYDKNAMNPYTYIHEMGHILGADDYYDANEKNSPMGGHDIMDSEVGDHNPYSKFNYGWLTSSRLVVAESTATLTLEDFSKNGDTIIIANNWDDTFGAYQEYYVLAYYTNNGLNSGNAGYFNKNGIVVYHVDATLYSELYENELYYDVKNTNTSVSDTGYYGTEDNLIEYVKSTSGNYCYGIGERISQNTKDNQDKKIAYTFKVDALTATTATITFTKNS